MTDDTSVTIDRLELGTGWVRFQAGDRPPPAEELPHILNHALTAWLERNPEFRITATLPITANGHTLAIHVWFT